jgi:hypothetical protein
MRFIHLKSNKKGAEVKKQIAREDQPFCDVMNFGRQDWKKYFDRYRGEPFILRISVRVQAKLLHSCGFLNQ